MKISGFCIDCAPLGRSAAEGTTASRRSSHPGRRPRSRPGSDDNPARGTYRLPMRRAVAILALGLALAACSSGPRLQLHPTGPTAVTPATSSSSAAVLPLRRGFLEIGTYGTEIFRPSFTIDIPVSSQWGTFGETGRRVGIGGQDGFFSFQALTAGGSPVTAAELRRVVAQPGVHVSGPSGSSFAGLPADRMSIVNGPGKLKVTFGGQHLSFFPHEHFFFSSRRRHTRWTGDWSSDVCSSD